MTDKVPPQNFANLIRLSRVLWLSLAIVMLGGLLEPEAAQPVSFAPKIDFGAGIEPYSVAVGDFNGDGKLDLAVANLNEAVHAEIPAIYPSSFATNYFQLCTILNGFLGASSVP